MDKTERSLSLRPLQYTEIEESVAKASCVLVATDFDGTLCSIAERPDAVQALPQATAVLQRLSKTPGVVLAVLSGRSLADLQSRVEVDAIFAGNHGLEISGGPFQFTHPEAERLAPKLRSMCEAVRQALAPWPDAWVEDKQLTATVHMRNCPSDDWISIRDAIRSVVRPVDDIFFLRNARASFEITPRTGWDKGSAVKYIQRELRLEDPLILCVGDDETDETVFRAFPEAVNIRVAPNGESDAAYSLENFGAVLDLFECIAGTLERLPRRRTSLTRALEHRFSYSGALLASEGWLG